MFALLRPLLVICCYLQPPGGDASGNQFLYQNIDTGNGHGEIFFDGIRLLVESSQSSVSATRGSSITLPCHFHYEPETAEPRRTRVKWSLLPSSARADAPAEAEVMVAYGNRHRSYGRFRGRVRLRRSAPGDLSLVIERLQVDDAGRYRCEVIDGLEDESATVELKLRGVVFPYRSRKGRYRLNFSGARRACEEQDARLATPEQLHAAWQDGLDWCNAGWLADGSVRYPITQPRGGCGGGGAAPGLRAYGRPHPLLGHFDAFCFSASIKGSVYFLKFPAKLNFSEAVQACAARRSQMATVGQIYAAWKLEGLDRCDAGWLADGSVRYPVGEPRANCGPPQPGVRSFGFPPKDLKFGVYCYR